MWVKLRNYCSQNKCSSPTIYPRCSASAARGQFPLTTKTYILCSLHKGGLSILCLEPLKCPPIIEATDLSVVESRLLVQLLKLSWRAIASYYESITPDVLRNPYLVIQVNCIKPAESCSWYSLNRLATEGSSSRWHILKAHPEMQRSLRKLLSCLQRCHALFTVVSPMVYYVSELLSVKGPS